MAALRSVLAVAAGIGTFTLFLLAMMSVGGRLLGTEPEWINRSLATQAAWLLWNIVSMTVAGYVTACIAPRAPVGHALAMAAVQTALTLIAFLTQPSTGTPAWLWIAGMVVTFPAAVTGARLRTGARGSLSPS